MKRVTTEVRIMQYGLTLMCLAILSAAPVAAQVPVDEYGNPIAPIDPTIDDTVGIDESAPAPAILSAAELEELVGPIALYPDDLLAIVLPASTYPLEIVQAARFLEAFEQDSSLEPDESWDESVVALLNYPDVLRMMDEDIDWTWRLGEAVIGQQAELIAAVEAFRDRAYAAGNLTSDERQTVTVDDGVIEIEPVDEEIIYVPYYEPAEVVVYQPRRVYYYYPRPYPVYYYPYPAGYNFRSSFRSGFFWGVTTAFTIGWATDHLHVYHPSYWGHPYYGRYYYGHYYRRPSISIFNNYYVSRHSPSWRYRYRDGDYWRPRRNSGARPSVQRVRNYEYAARTGDTRQRSTRTRSTVERASNQRRSSRIAGLNLRTRDDARHNARSDNRVTLQSGNTTARRTATQVERRSRDNRRFTGSSGTNRVIRTDRSSRADVHRSDNRSNRRTVTTRRQQTARQTLRQDIGRQDARTSRSQPPRVRSSQSRPAPTFNRSARGAVAEQRAAPSRRTGAVRAPTVRSPSSSRPRLSTARPAPQVREPARSSSRSSSGREARSSGNRRSTSSSGRRESRTQARSERGNRDRH